MPDPNVLALVGGSAKKQYVDQNPDPDQLFYALGHVSKDIIYDVSFEIQQLISIANHIPEGSEQNDPLGHELKNVLLDLAYNFKLSLRSGGSINSVFLNKLTTESTSVRYDVINRDSKAKGVLNSTAGMLGFHSKKSPEPPPV